MKTRIYFLDNLRTFLILMVIVLHAGIVYEPILENTWIVSDPVKNSSIGLIRMYLDLFVMFTMFYISGYFIPFSLKKNNTWGFIKSKLTRIMLPWLLAVLTLIPATKVIFLYSRGLPQQAWFSYFHVYHRAGGDVGNFADFPTQSWLWFLPVLFMFQMLYLLLSKTNLLSLKINFKTGVVLTIIIGLIYSMIIKSAGLIGWYHSALLHFQNERLLIYFMVFLLGSLSNRLKVFDSNQYSKRFYLIANIVFSLSLGIFTAVALNLFYNMINPGRNFYFISETVDRIGYYLSMLLSMFGFLYILIHLFHTKLNRINPLMAFMNRSSYSVYIIHLVVLGLFALVLVPVHIPVYFKFLILSILTFAVSNFLIYLYNTLVKGRIYLRAAAAVSFLIVFLIITGSGKEEVKASEIHATQIAQVSDGKPEMGIHEAIIIGRIDIVKQHIALGTDLNEREPSGGSSPLITAALFGNTDAAKALITAGANVNAKNNDGSTALHTAAFFCRTEIVKMLLNNGADPALRNNAGSTPLESVIAPFEAVKGIYDYFQNTLGPLGLNLDYEFIQKTRPEIASLLKQFN